MPRHLLPEHHAVLFAHHKPFPHLALMERTDVFGGFLQNFKELRLHCITCGEKFFHGHLKRRAFRHAVKRGAIALHGRVALPAHGGKDVRNLRGHIRRILPACKHGFRAQLVGIKNPYHVKPLISAR